MRIAVLGNYDFVRTCRISRKKETVYELLQCPNKNIGPPPIAFELDGVEFVAVAAGGSALWGSPKGDTVFAFGLPKKWEPSTTK